MNAANHTITIPFYPEYILEKGGYQTYLRKLHEGEWYLFLIKTTDDFDFFIRMCYLAILFGQITPEFKDANGGYLYKKDENQQSEEERLLPKFNI